MSETREEQEINDVDLVARTQAGDPRAFDALVRKYSQRLYGLVYNMTSNHEDTNDLLQDIFAKAYRSIKGFKGKSSFYTWLYRIATNLAIDWVRKGKRRNTGSFDEAVAQRDGAGGIAEPHHQDSPSRALERKQLYASIMAALDSLPDDQKQVLLLRELEGLSYKEISDIVDALQTWARRLNAPVVLDGEIVALDEGGEVKKGVRARRGNFGRRQPRRCRAATTELGLHRGESALGLGQVGLDLRGDLARRRRFDGGDCGQIVAERDEFPFGETGGLGAFPDAPALADGDQADQHEGNGEG
jgi:RNA polymerase sigma-70 factor (ECF subfamily)